jgi:hypothetical protein
MKIHEENIMRRIIFERNMERLASGDSPQEIVTSMNQQLLLLPVEQVKSLE